MSDMTRAVRECADAALERVSAGGRQFELEEATRLAVGAFGYRAEFAQEALEKRIRAVVRERARKIKAHGLRRYEAVASATGYIWQELTAMSPETLVSLVAQTRRAARELTNKANAYQGVLFEWQSLAGRVSIHDVIIDGRWRHAS